MKTTWIVTIIAIVAVAGVTSALAVSSMSDTETVSTELVSNEMVDQPAKLKIFTSFYPIHQFTKGIAGDVAEVELLIPMNVEPHDYELTPQKLVALKNADVLVYNGADFEPFVEQIIDSGEFTDLVLIEAVEGIELLEGDLLKDLELTVLEEDHDDNGHEEGHDSHAEEFAEEIEHVIEEFEHGHIDASQAIASIEEILHEHEGDGHDHGNETLENIEEQLHEIEEGHVSADQGIEGIHHIVLSIEEEHEDGHDEHEGEGGHGHHHHGSFTHDPHVWLDPILAKDQVNNIASGLMDVVDDSDVSRIQTNTNRYNAQLDALDAHIRDELSSCKRDTFMPFHNAFTYFGERYDLKPRALAGLDPELNPSPAEIETMIKFAEDNDIQYFFHEELVDTKIADVLAEHMGGGILIFSPLEGLTDEDIENNATYFDKMYKNIDQLKIALDCS